MGELEKKQAWDLSVLQGRVGGRPSRGRGGQPGLAVSLRVTPQGILGGSQVELADEWLLQRKTEGLWVAGKVVGGGSQSRGARW